MVWNIISSYLSTLVDDGELKGSDFNERFRPALESGVMLGGGQWGRLTDQIGGIFGIEMNETVVRQSSDPSGSVVDVEDVADPVVEDE